MECRNASAPSFFPGDTKATLALMAPAFPYPVGRQEGQVQGQGVLRGILVEALCPSE